MQKIFLVQLTSHQLCERTLLFEVVWLDLCGDSISTMFSCQPVMVVKSCKYNII